MKVEDRVVVGCLRGRIPTGAFYDGMGDSQSQDTQHALLLRLPLRLESFTSTPLTILPGARLHKVGLLVTLRFLCNPNLV